MTTRTIHTEDELGAILEEVLEMLVGRSGTPVIALTGELGAGKTTFVQLLAKRLGVTEHVTSPTFLIMRRYETTNDRFSALVHIDAYRIEDPHELEVIGVPDVMREAGTLVCIEWPERASGIVPKDAYRMSLELHDDGTRTVTYGD